MVLDALRVPVVQAPLAGGPSTPRLAAAVCSAGGLGFVASGYKTAEAMRSDIEATRSLTDAGFGVNVFVPGPVAAEPGSYQPFMEELSPEAERFGLELGEPRFEDDDWEAKITQLAGDPVAVVSFTFGCPSVQVINRLQASGTEVWVTITSPVEAQQAFEAGADALILQGVEAGGHRGSWVDRDDAERYGLLALIQVVREIVTLPLIAAGGIANGAALAAVLCAGARAAQMGTAFMRCPEAATSDTHQDALASARSTTLTRAFSGRLARGLVNRFIKEHGHAAPSAYPEIHHVTSPLRAAGRNAGDPEVINLWAGQTHELAQPLPARELVRKVNAEAEDAIKRATHALPKATT